MSNIQNAKLRFQNIKDEGLRKNLEFLLDIFSTEFSLKFDWKFIVFSVDGAVSNLAIPHTCNYVPLDILPTQSVGNITFNYSNFTDKFIFITTSGAASFRGLVGRYEENTE